MPPTANQTISMLKLTSLVLVIGMLDLLATAQQIYGRNFQQIPMLIVASIWYLALTTVLTFVQSRLEKRMSKGVHAMNATNGGSQAASARCTATTRCSRAST